MTTRANLTESKNSFTDLRISFFRHTLKLFSCFHSLIVLLVKLSSSDRKSANFMLSHNFERSVLSRSYLEVEHGMHT
ncbi:hypothetical protein BpHYR1_003708 [Brachionus plicatilis]|uniref:Uncharacterized protein n=1 Tax=Brachionus plicatilis TaxID=10195 RepID=A0A3M7RED4_BRAPC|nr:hypothetical protein BpHYR1_003708 [Brachionus plicatilis]